MMQRELPTCDALATLRELFPQEDIQALSDALVQSDWDVSAAVQSIVARTPPLRRHWGPALDHLVQAFVECRRTVAEEALDAAAGDVALAKEFLASQGMRRTRQESEAEKNTHLAAPPQGDDEYHPYHQQLYQLHYKNPEMERLWQAIAALREESRRCMQAGDRRRGLALWEKVKEHTATYREFQQKAGQRIARSLNAASETSNHFQLDLHALQCREAIRLVEEHVERIETGIIPFRITLITGQGHHSQGEPKLRQAVVETLIARGLAPVIDPSNPGVVRVTVRPK